MRSAILFMAGLALAACARPIERGQALYQDGRYVEAAEMFELTEPRLASLPAESCATFGLYRGLTYLRLGDGESARRWLAYAYSVEHKSPGMLLPEQRRLLERGWAELERKGIPAPASPDDGDEQPRMAAAAPPALSNVPPRTEASHDAPPPPAPAPAVQ